VRKILLAIALTFLFVLSIQAVKSAEFDRTSQVTWVQDGDTFKITNDVWVRLADIDAPEDYQTNFYASKWYLYDLVFGKTVYLDIDDNHQTDPHGRLVCVAYVYHNASHYLNVNKDLIERGYAVVLDYTNNEFTPSSWTLYLANPNYVPPYNPPTNHTNPPTNQTNPPTNQTNPPTNQTQPGQTVGPDYTVVIILGLVAVVGLVIALYLRSKGK